MSKIMKFDAYFECEEWKLKQMKRSTKPNSSDEQQHIGNRKWKYNVITKKYDDLSPAEVDDKIQAIEDWKHLKLFQTLTESNVFLDKNTIHKITMSEKRLPELMMNLAGLTDYVKLNDQYGIKVLKIEKSTFGALSRTFYITCSVSRPGHKFSFEEVMVNGKKTVQAPIDDVKFEVKIVK